MTRHLSNEGIMDQTSDINDIYFEPRDLLDLSVHYCGVTFHMHSVLVLFACKFLSNDIRYNRMEARRCASCVNIQSKQHRCITLDGPSIGGRQTQAEQLRVFFAHLYSVLDVSRSWVNSIRIGDQVECCDESGWALSEVTSISSAGRYVDLKSFRLDNKTKISVSLLRPAYTSQHDQRQPHYTNTFIDSSLFFLAHCLQCSQLEDMYDRRAVSFIHHQLMHTQRFDGVWKILRLADVYRWPNARSACLHALLHDSACAATEDWETNYQSLKRETLAELLALSLSQHKRHTAGYKVDAVISEPRTEDLVTPYTGPNSH